MHLIEKYSLNCGISPSKLEKPYIYTSYYPLACDKYVIIHPSSGMPSKNYSYFQEVIDFIYEPLKKLGYDIVQIGESQDQQLLKCINLQGKTDLHQSCFLLKGASLFIGNDSFSTHVASSYGIPLISLYSTIQPEVAGPYWKNKNQFTLMAPLYGKKPKYSTEDPEKVIDRIKPEQILEKISIAIPELDLSKYKNLKSVFIGSNYPRASVECVPDSPSPVTFHPKLAMNIRFDFLKSKTSDYNIDCACANLATRKCGIVVSDEIDLDKFKIPNIKQNIISFVFHIEKKNLNKIDKNINFILKAKKEGFPVKVATVDKNFTKDEVEDLKFKFLNIQHINFLKETSWEENLAKEDFSKITDLTIFKSSRIIFSQNKAFLSKIAYLEDKPVALLEQPIKEIKNLKELGKELESCYIYNL
jgi:hypothetical protein